MSLYKNWICDRLIFTDPFKNHVQRHRDVVAESQVVEDADHEVEDDKSDVGSQGNAGSKFPEFGCDRETLHRDEQERGEGHHVDGAGVDPEK